MMLLNEIQQEIAPWTKYNFGDRPAWQPLLGLVEEVGELSHAYLKREQKIRTTEDHDAAIRDAVGDILIYLMDFCNIEKINLASAVTETWLKVRIRNWKDNPKTG